MFESLWNIITNIGPSLWIAIAYFLILSIGTMLFLGRKVKSGTDLVTGSRTFAWPLVIAAFVLAPLGSGHTFALWEMQTVFGASVLWWGIIAGGIFVPLFLLWFGPWFRQLKVQTFPQGMGKIFGENIGWLIAAVFPVQLIGICISEVLATAAAFYALGGESITYQSCTIMAVIFTIIYIIVAGLMQVAWMNLFNAIMLILGSFAAVVATSIWLTGESAAKLLGQGGEAGWSAVEKFYTDNGQLLHTSIMDFSPDVIFGWILPAIVLIVFMCSASQAQYQPMLLAKSDSDVRKGVFFAAIVNSMVTYPWVILGLVAMSIPAVATVGAKLCLPKLAVLTSGPLPPWMVGILMISLLAATLSTTSQLILASSHLIVHDIFKKAVNPGMSDKSFLILTRVMIIVCAGLVILPALKIGKQSIMGIFFWTFSFGIPVFGVYLIGMLWKVNKAAAWITMLAGYGANFLWTFAPDIWLPAKMSSNKAVYATISATIIFGIVLNLILPGKPGYLRQMKAAKQNESVPA